MAKKTGTQRARSRKRGRRLLAQQCTGKVVWGKRVVVRKAALKNTKATQSGTTVAIAADMNIGVPHGFSSEFVAISEGCLDREVATVLVFSCTGVGQPVNLDTQLGVLFPSDVRRRGFCGCVFNKAAAAGARVSPDQIPCSPNNTIGDVINSISC